jgi:hypothetical protein
VLVKPPFGDYLFTFSLSLSLSIWENIRNLYIDAYYMVDIHPHLISILPSYFRVHHNKLRILRSQVWEMFVDYISIFGVPLMVKYELDIKCQIDTPELCKNCYSDPLHRKLCRCIYFECPCGYGIDCLCGVFPDNEDFLNHAYRLFMDNRVFRREIINELVNYYLKKNELIVSMNKIICNKFPNDISRYVILPFLF